MTEQAVLPEPEQSAMEEPADPVAADAGQNQEQKPDRQDEEMIRISDCISCTAVNDGEEITVPLHLKWMCSHEHGAVLHADGPLMAGINRPYIVHSTTIPEIKMNADFAIHVEFDPSAEKNHHWCTVYSMDDEFRETDNSGDFNTLAPGRYLVDVFCSVTRGEEYYDGHALIKLEVAG